MRSEAHRETQPSWLNYGHHRGEVITPRALDAHRCTGLRRTGPTHKSITDSLLPCSLGLGRRVSTHRATITDTSTEVDLENMIDASERMCSQGHRAAMFVVDKYELARRERKKEERGREGESAVQCKSSQVEVSVRCDHTIRRRTKTWQQD